MAKKDDDKEETALIALLIFHQFLLEGYKAWLRAQFSAVAVDLAEIYRKVINQIDVEHMSDLTKAELNERIKRLDVLQSSVYNKYIIFVMSQIKKLNAFENDFARLIYTQVSGKHLELPTNKTVMSKVTNTPLGANGLLLIPFSTGFIQNEQKQAKLELTKAYANGDTPKSVQLALIGVKTKKYRDGLLARVFGRNAAYVNTAIQHVSSVAQATVASVFYDRYRWLSVMDAVTTEICVSRNKVIYFYGQGPLPPAHYHCRSKTSPITETAIHNEDMSIVSWLQSQPAIILNMLFQAKTVKLIQLAKIDYNTVKNNVKPLTIEKLNDNIKLLGKVK